MSRRAARIDANQPSIVRALRMVPGVSVAITSQLGKGFPDIAVGRKGKTYLFEIKDPAKSPSARELTKHEEEFHANWTGHVDTVLTVEEILTIMGM